MFSHEIPMDSVDSDGFRLGIRVPVIPSDSEWFRWIPGIPMDSDSNAESLTDSDGFPIGFRRVSDGFQGVPLDSGGFR